MTTNQQIKKWRTRQIAATILYRICGNVRIESVPENSVYDLLVSFIGDNIGFGVKVASSSYIDSIGYRMYLEGMQKYHHPSRKKFIPIILMCVNEAQESAQMGIQYAWMYNHGITIKKVRLHQATEKVWPRFRDSINSMFDAIRSIAIENLYIVRDISLTIHDATGELRFANSIYLRKVSENYRINRRDPETEKERTETLLQVIRQDEYPSDTLDDAIEEALDNSFEISRDEKRLLLFSPDIARLQRDVDMHKVQKNIVVEPKFEIGVNPPLGQLPVIQLTFYTHDRRAIEYISSHNLFTEHRIDDFFQYYLEIEELKKTMAQPEDVLVI